MTERHLKRSDCLSNPLANDLNDILRRTHAVWDELRGRRIFITGGTGFIGAWLLESFCWANDQLGIGSQAVVLTRNPDAFRAKAPHLANHPAVELLTGDVRTFEFPKGTFSHVVHAATDTGARSHDEDDLLLFDTIVQGTRRALEFAVRAGAGRFLLTSSGAVYGWQPGRVTHISEDFAGAPSPCEAGSAYGEGKRAAELLCASFARRQGLPAKIARCFTFVGPYLPVDANYAIGNFVGAAIREQPITVTGNRMTVRSYLYTADMAVWLWTILVRGEAGRPYNVGSEHAVTMAELANCVAQRFKPEREIQFLLPFQVRTPAGRYVPSTRRAADELGLSQTVGLGEALRRYIRFAAGPAQGESA